MTFERRISYLKSAYLSLARYDRDIVKRLINDIDNIPMSDIKRLKGYNNPNLYRLRVGKYRVIYFLAEDEEIIIAQIDTRGDIYK